MHTKRLAGFLLSAFFTIGSATAFGADDIQMTPKQTQALGITVGPLSAQTGVPGNGFPAQVVIPNGQLQVVSAPLSGLIQSVAVSVNDTVTKGQMLARFASPMLIETQRDFLQAATQTQLTQSSLKRDAQLFKEGIIAEGRYLSTRSAHAQAAAGLSERRQALRLYGMTDTAINKLQSSHVLSSSLDIVATMDGVVLEQMATIGQRVEAATPLFKVARLNPLWLEIQVSAAYVAGVKAGTVVSVRGISATGKVLSIGRNVSANQTVMVRADIKGDLQSLHAGQFVEVQLVSSLSAEKQWQVPSSALARNQEKAFVFVQTSGGFRAQPVTLVGQSQDSSTISGNLKGSEHIAVKGIAALKAAWMGLGGGE